MDGNTNDNKKPALSILRGGQTLDIEESNRHFISAYVTDTRLMGVLAVYAHWHLDNMPSGDGKRANNAAAINEAPAVTWGDLHQFFYIDCEEAGIETYHQVRTSDNDEVERLEQTIIGGLGAGKIDLNELQLKQLLCIWKSFNDTHGLPLPRGKKDYGFLFADSDVPNKNEQIQLMKHICPEIKTDYQLINYFLMRCFGRDHEGAEFLTYSDSVTSVSDRTVSTVDTGIYDRYIQATLWRNVIEKKADLADGSKEYLCESIVETNGTYSLIVSLITLKDLAVTGIECKSISPMAQAEAALTMKKSEFVTVYDVLLSDEQMDENIDEFILSFHMTMSELENGRLFLSYRPNNDHVNRRVFQLNEDVNGLLFLTVGGQLILSAYSEADAALLEAKLRSNVLSPHLLITGRYEFRNPVLYEFMHSDIDYFETYLQILTSSMQEP